MGKLISPDELLELVPGTTKGYWAQLRFHGTGPAFYKPTPKVVLYDVDTVLEWVRASARTQTGEQVPA